MALEIVDAHHHLWDLGRNYYPWLCDDDAPHHRYGDQRPIRRNYLPADYRADSAGHAIVATVHVEAVFDSRDPVAETRWLDEVREKSGMPAVAVVQAILEADDVEKTLAAHSRFPFVRGIRHRLRLTTPAPGAQTQPRASFDDPAFRRGFALLEGFGMSCDIVAPPRHLGEIADLAHDFPGTQIVLNHCGNPSDRSAQGLAAWRAGLLRVAQEPNVVVKVSGIGMPGQPWTAEGNAPIMRETIQMFGVDRCLFASNFPVDSLVTDFDAIVRTTAAVVNELPEGAREKIFRDNARRIYRIP